MAILAFLCRLVVIGRGCQDRIYTRPRRHLLGFLDSVTSRVGSSAGHDGHAPRHDFDGDIDNPQPLVMRQGRGFAGGPAGNQKIDSGLDLPRHQVAQRRLVDGAVLTKGSYESCTASAKLHENKIARMGGLANLAIAAQTRRWGLLNSESSAHI